MNPEKKPHEFKGVCLGPHLVVSKAQGVVTLEKEGKTIELSTEEVDLFLTIMMSSSVRPYLHVV